MKITKIPPKVIPYMATIPAIFPYCLQRVAGEYYGIMGASIANGATAVVADKLYTAPFLVLQEETFDRISITVGTGAAGNAHLGIYADNGACKPGELVLDAGTIDTTAAGDKEIIINQTLSPGLYWLTSLYNATPSMRYVSAITNLLGTPGLIAQGGIGISYYTTQAYGALPATHPTPAPSGNIIPAVCLRRA